MVGSTLTLLALTASSALAHYCYNASRSDRGNEAAGRNSAVFVTVDGLIDMLQVFIPELCGEAVDYLHEWADEEGLSDKLVHTGVAMASGAEGGTTSFDGRGIDHLPESVIDEAFGQCPA